MRGQPALSAGDDTVLKENNVTPGGHHGNRSHHRMDVSGGDPHPAGRRTTDGGRRTAGCRVSTFRDSAVFTTKRLIVRDAQGITGKKVEIYSLPYSAINMWSSENAGTIDFNAELELWTRAGHIKIKLGRAVDIRRLDHLISHAVLGGFDQPAPGPR